MPNLPAFHDDKIFPTDIAYQSTGGAEFMTEITELGKGREQRAIKWPFPKQRWDVGYGIKTVTQMNALLEFHMARRGRAYGFRFFDHDDHEAVQSYIGVGDGETLEFKLYKTYEEGSYQFMRRITRPVGETVRIFLDDVEDVSNWSIDDTTGIVTFDSGSPPGSGVEIRASFTFHIPMRFDNDWLPKEFSEYEARSATVQLVELIEDDE